VPAPFRILRLDGAEALPVWDGALRTPVQQRLGLAGFGANAYSATEAGQRVIEEHDHAGSGGQEELYVVLAGRAAFTIGGEQLEAPVGTLVFVRPEARRAATALDAGTTVLVVGAPLGAPYRAPPWPAEAEMWRYRELFEAADYRGASSYLEGVLARFPGNAAILAELARCRRALKD
jgi:quercetin dioxygenase-like cupin family protein